MQVRFVIEPVGLKWRWIMEVDGAAVFTSPAHFNSAARARRFVGNTVRNAPVSVRE